MSWLFEFRVLPWDMDRFTVAELEAIAHGLRQIEQARSG